MHAQHLERKVSHHVGTDNAIHASCWNNIALMQKSLGKLKEAMESYEKALAMYEKVVSKKHVSYINTLMNFGVLHKSFADVATTEEDHNNYLSDARRLIETAIDGLVSLKGGIAFLRVCYILFRRERQGCFSGTQSPCQCVTSSGSL